LSTTLVKGIAVDLNSAVYIRNHYYAITYYISSLYPVLNKSPSPSSCIR